MGSRLSRIGSVKYNQACLSFSLTSIFQYITSNSQLHIHLTISYNILKTLKATQVLNMTEVKALCIWPYFENLGGVAPCTEVQAKA